MRTRGLPWLVMAWLAALLAGWLAVQIAVHAGQLGSIGQWLSRLSCCATFEPVAEWLVSLAVCALIIAAGAGIGRRIIGARGEAIDRAALSIGIGLGVLSAATLLAGLAGWLRLPLAWIGLILIAAAFFRSIRAWWSDLISAARSLSAPDGLSRWAAVYVGLALALAFCNALAPATAWDALVYHLKGPEVFLAAGRIDLPIDLPYLGFPQAQEMLFLLARWLGAPNVALLHWVFAVATTLLVASLSRRLWGESAGWIAAAIFLSAQSIVELAGWPYVDLTLAFWVTAAYVCLRYGRDESGSAWLRLAGAFAGLALATKYTAIPAVIGLGLAALAISRRAGHGGRTWGQFVGVALLVAAPWYAKNWIVAANPMYPFFFAAPYWDAYRASWYSRFGTGLIFTAPPRLLLAPFESTILGVEGRAPYSATIGPLFLMFAPFGVVAVWRRLQPYRDILIVCGSAAAGWLVMIATSALLVQTRLLFPIFPLLAVLAAGGVVVLRSAPSLPAGLRRLVSIIVGAALAWTAAMLVIDFAASQVPSVLAGGQSREEYLVERTGWHALAMQSVNALPPGARVLFLWEPRSLYCRVDCRPDALLDRWWHARRTLGSAEAVAQAWREQGVTHVLLNRAGYQFVRQAQFDPLSADDWAALQDLIDDHLTLIQDFGGVYALYEWRHPQ